jgi:hypothetical protein
MSGNTRYRLSGGIEGRCENVRTSCIHNIAEYTTRSQDTSDWPELLPYDLSKVAKVPASSSARMRSTAVKGKALALKLVLLLGVKVVG